ncbi:MAG: undecaprenyldiphospho-muramoylpentapeptide beta-N-acetylglucosaminyltransferase, partial [Hyphomicrobiaceae bacterium]
MNKSIMLAAGGSGGHLFPAFALAEKLNQRGYTVDLATDKRGDRFGADFPARNIFEIPSATTTSRSPIALTKTALTLAGGVRKAHKIIGQAAPAAVIGFGGYPSFPPVVAAAIRSIPTAIHEQNAVLGRANRMLAGRVRAIATSFENIKHLAREFESKVRITGNPVRTMVIEASARDYHQPSRTGPIHLLVFGGSQGARYFSDLVPPAVANLPDDIRSRMIVMQQCREEDVERVRQAYQQAGVSATCETFFSDLPKWISEAHLVIGRGGATTIAELTTIGCPSVLVPLPHSIDNDQLENATCLANAGAAWCIEQKDLNVERLTDGLFGV